MDDNQEDRPQTERYFTTTKRKGSDGSEGDVNGQNSGDINGSDEQVEEQGQCLTLRFVQRLMPCLEKKGIWEASQGDVEKSHEVEETKYPLVLRILESKIVDIIFVLSCITSGLLFFFAEGFLLNNLTLSGIIHTVNAIYTLGLFGQWLRILVESKYSKTNQGYTKVEVILSLASIFPSDLIVLAIYSINDRTLETPGDRIVLTLSRLNYLIRLFYAQKHLSSWENQLVLGDIAMFLIRLSIYVIFFIHAAGCLWHRTACSTFTSRHFQMTPQEAAADVCLENSWVIILLFKSRQLANFPENGSVLFNHYLASIYWVVNTAFRFGDGDIDIFLTSTGEVIFAAATQILSWIFTLAFVTGTLTSLMIEHDTERESYRTRRFAIKQYLNFSYTGKSIAHDVRSFYDFLWERRKGVLQLDLVDKMPPTMKGEVFYDINRFVINQLPLIAKLEEAVLMKLAIRMRHSFHLEGEILFRKNQTGRCLFYILKGFLEVLNDKETLPLITIKSGSAIGEIYLMHPYPHGATVRCGTQCDILILTREDFREVIDIYPELWEELKRRLTSRIDQSEVALNLVANKYNGYIAAFKNINVTIKPLQDYQAANKNLLEADNLGEVLLNEHPDLGDRNVAGSIIDIAGFSPELVRRQSSNDDRTRLEKKIDKQRRRRSLEEEAYATLESDILGATKLCKDWNIPVPPLIVAVPTRFMKVSLKKKSSTHFLKNAIPTLELNHKSFWHFLWKSLISFCILLYIWFITFMWAFRRPEIVFWGYVAHIIDVFVVVDFCLDLLETVVTPQRTLDSTHEILLYKVKTKEFYVRVFGFFPWEYIIAVAARWTWKSGNVNPWLYFLKLNRALELIVVDNFFREIESISTVPMLPFFMFKFTIVTVFLIHVFGTSYEFLLRDMLGREPMRYSTPFYRSTQVIVTIGYGDFDAESDSEIIAITAGLVVGTAVIIYFGAKVAALLANSARRRLFFKHMYYSLLRFMKQRNFSDDLANRVSGYYGMQWISHEGVLIPTAKSVIWDAPKTLIERVTAAQALRFVSRVPLSQHTFLDVQTTFCKALRRYFVPPGETILYPGDFRRELFIIAKGFCQVLNADKELIGTLGEGNYFGLPGLVSGTNLQFEIVTETHCQFFCLLYEDFLMMTEKDKSLAIDFRVLRGQIKPENRRRSTVTKAKLNPPDPKEEDEIRDDSNDAAFHVIVQQLKSIEASVASIRSQKSVVKSSPSTNEASTAIPQTGPQIAPANKKIAGYFGSLLLKMTVKPNGSFMKYWTIIRICAAVLVTIFALAQAAFAFHPTYSFFFMMILDGIAWADIYIMLHLAYYDEKNKFMVLVGKTTKHYLMGPFLLDLIACFPFEVIVFIISPSSVGVMLSLSPGKMNYGGNYGLCVISFLRLNRMLQIYRLFTGANFLNKSILRSITFVTLAEIVPMMFVFVNTLACISFLVFCHWDDTKAQTTCASDAWISNFLPLHPAELGKTWLTKPNYTVGPLAYYIFSLYWVTQTAFKVGFGDFSIKDDKNEALVIIVVLLGTLVSFYLSGKLAASSFGKDSRRIAMREEMEVLFGFMSQYCVSQSTQRRVQETYFKNWERNGGVSSTDFFVALHPSLKAEAASELYEASLVLCPLLKDLDRIGVRMLASKLEEVFYPEGEYIMRFGDLNDDFFLITNGIIVSYKENGTDIISYMGPGSLIGEISAILDIRRVFSAVAATNVVAFVFHRSDFLEFLDLYPELAVNLEYACIQHYRESIHTPRNDADIVVPGDDDEPRPLRDLALLGDVERGEGRRVAQVLNRVTVQESEPDGTDTENKTEEARGSTDSDQRYAWDTDENLVGSYVNLTESEASRHPEFIVDPIRVTTVFRKEAHDSKSSSGTPQGKRRNIKCLSSLVTFGRIPRNEMGILHIYQEKNECTICNIVIHPACRLCSSSILICLYLLITCISCSIASFEISFKLDNHSESDRRLVVGLRYAAELFFVVRFIGNFHLCYYNDDGLFITKKSAIIKRYLKRPDGFILDVLTTFPFNFFEFLSNKYSTKSMYTASSALLVLKLLRVFLFIRYLKATDLDLRIKVSQIKIVKICIVLSFIFHFCACAWYLIACYGFDCIPGSWVSRTIERMINEQGKLVTKPEEVSVSTRYFMSLFFVTTLITFTGLDNVLPSTLQEITLTICMMFATVFLIGYLVGEMMQCLASQIARKIHYQHELAILEEHFVTLGLTKPKMKEVRRYYKTLWQKSKGMSYYDLLQKLPYPLRADIAFEVYGPSVKGCRILSRVDEVITREICARMKHEIYLPGAHIIRAKEMCDAMYLIKKGEIVILDENQNLELCVEVLYENECFGEVELPAVKLLLPREQYHFSYIARLESEVGVLHRQDFEEIFSNYPSLKAELILRANKLKRHRTKQGDNENDILEQFLDALQTGGDQGEDEDEDEEGEQRGRASSDPDRPNDFVARLSVHGGKAIERLRLFSISARQNIDSEAFRLVRKGSQSSQSSHIR